MNLFEKAVFNHWRFSSGKGDLTIEDVVTLPLEHSRSASLEQVAQILYKDIKENSISFVHKTQANTETNEKLELVKYIIDKRLAEAAAKADEAYKAKRIKELEALKQQKQIETATVEDIEKELKALKNA